MKLIVTALLVLFTLTTHSQTSDSKTSDDNQSVMKMTKEVLYRAENGALKSREDLFNSKISSYTIYDKNERPIEFGQYEIDGSLYEKTTYERDENGNAKKAIIENASGDLTSYRIYKYDSESNMIEVRTFDTENNLSNVQSNT
ncbi:hypothetical protein LX97_02659 [Nonlabens dokdonensis]|jgi:hypothetical protein|uniref:Uncharacterized protein n=2 Tax=Nonlabens dokdonensis TaxID=328515 RepID=L7WF51_NONDD|nr:hypothetical protein [Nonlabens dokdonensis]AGC78576.1 hypothetical protein DDD_3449 [Nonlabens dokdonensis DSW-6]PZX39293.1 hypothetical protein LX97_02659 [Nonlabens dokdonensis]